MAIYTCFIQHVINSLKKTGKGAIVIPTGFITAKSGIENKILHKIVDDKWYSAVFPCQATCLLIQVRMSVCCSLISLQPLTK